MKRLILFVVAFVVLVVGYGIQSGFCQSGPEVFTVGSTGCGEGKTWTEASTKAMSISFKKALEMLERNKGASAVLYSVNSSKVIEYLVEKGKYSSQVKIIVSWQFKK